MSATGDRPYGIGPGRPGLTPDVVFRTAERLLREGTRPTVAAVRAVIGGSNSTVAPLLDDWWKDLSQRIAGGPAAMDRVPASLAHVVEALYLQTLSDARVRARQELSAASQSAERHKMDVEVRSHVLSLRETELEERLRASDRKLLESEAEIRTLTLMLRKEQASHVSARQQLESLQEALVKMSQRRRPGPVRPRAKPKKRVLPRARISRRSKSRRR